MPRFPRRFVAPLLISLLTAACAGGGSSAATSTAIPVGPTRAPASTPTASPTTPKPNSPATSTPTLAPSPTTPPTISTPSPATAQPTTNAPAPTAAPQPTSPPQATSISLSFRAFDNAFDKKSARVKVGTTITATMQNDDAGIDHNLAFSLPGLAHGETCAGPCSTTQTFKAEKAGSYYFLCTIHDMVGTFIVDP